MKQLFLTAICAAATFGTVKAANDIKLQYDPQLVSAGFPSPLLRGTIRGQSVWFLVDTGAGVHVIASWFAKSAQIPTKQGRTRARGSTGAEVLVSAASGETIRIDGTNQELRLRQAAVIEFPAKFEEQKIAGLISPQLLSPKGQAAILDLREPRLSFGPPPEPTVGTRICRNPESPFENLSYAAPVTSGDVEAVMVVDTGATGTTVSPASTLGSTLAPRATQSKERIQGVGAPPQSIKTVSGVPLKFGDGQVTITVSLGGPASSTCGPAGTLGMDALRQCKLVMGGGTFAWSCGSAR
jgi:hypothetical protein